MFTQIVVLYICCLLNLPTWCKVLVTAAIAINLTRAGYGFCKGFYGIDEKE